MEKPKTVERPRAYPKPTPRASDGQLTPVTQRHKVEVLEQRRHKSTERQDGLRKLEDELLEKSLETMRAALSFASIPFDATEVPEDLVWAFGEQRAGEIFRTMKAAQMCAKDAPVGLLLAQRTSAAIIRARSMEKAAPSQLNVAIQVVQSAPLFEEMDVE